MRTGRVAVQGTQRKEAVRLKLGFSGGEFGYCITMGLPAPSNSAFALDPEIKRECIWSGPVFKPERVIVTHSAALIAALGQGPETRVIELEKELGQTQVKAQNFQDRPQWRWIE